MLDNKPTIAFTRNKNIQGLIDDHLIRHEKVLNKKLEKRQGKSKTCNIRISALSFVQVVNINTLKNTQTDSVVYTMQLHAKVNRSIFIYLIYLLKCILLFSICKVTRKSLLTPN